MMKATAPITGGMIWPPIDDGGFDRAGEHGRVAEALHQRDGELADGEHVRDTRARDRAHQPGRDHRHLGRTAACMAHEAERDVVEELDHPGVLEEAAEQDEQEDVRGRDQGRDAEDAFGAEEELADDLVHAVAAVRDGGRQILAEHAVGEEGRADDRQREAQHATRGLEHQHDEHAADDEIGHVRIPRALDQLGLEREVVEREGEGHGGEHRVPPVDAVALRALAEGVDQERQREQKADVDGARRQARQRREARDDELIRGEAEGDRGDGLRRDALQLALDARFVERLLVRHVHERVVRRAGHCGFSHQRARSRARDRRTSTRTPFIRIT